MDPDFFSSPSGIERSSPQPDGHQHQPSTPIMNSSEQDQLTDNHESIVPRGSGGSQNGSMISRIEDILEDIVDALNDNRPLSIPMRSRSTGREDLVQFPTASKAGAKRFTCLLVVLYHCHEALVSRSIITKRHIFYQNIQLFETQAYADRIVDEIALTFGVGRDTLNIVATAKGLIAGRQFHDEQGNHVCAIVNEEFRNTKISQGVAIPCTRSLDDICLNGVQWILIIEKEATFRSLAASQYYNHSAAGPGLLVTGKGYPDLATRRFLHLVQSQFPHMPQYALVDFDPDGIGIMRTYRTGSVSLGHEVDVTAPGLVWLGVKSVDVFGRNPRQRSSSQPLDGTTGPRQTTLPDSGTSSSSQPTPRRPSSSRLPEALCNASPCPTRLASVDYKTNPLTARERLRAVNLLGMYGNQGSLEAEDMAIMRELQFMLILNIKFEIQALDDGGNMEDWLDERLSPVLV